LNFIEGDEVTSLGLMAGREFLILTGTFAAGCSSQERALGTERILNAGQLNNYAADGVYSAFRERGFFIVRHGICWLRFLRNPNRKIFERSLSLDAYILCWCHQI
jgi:hypothetical protein